METGGNVPRHLLTRQLPSMRCRDRARAGTLTAVVLGRWHRRHGPARVRRTYAMTIEKAARYSQAASGLKINTSYKTDAGYN